MADKDYQTELGTWECNQCGESDGVINGVCPNCGPTQTRPIDKKAELIAGVPEAEAERIAKEEAEKNAESETDGTPEK
jgi:hypothetical protein